MLNFLKRLFGNARGQKPVVPAIASTVVPNFQANMLYLAPQVAQVVPVPTTGVSQDQCVSGMVSAIPSPLNVFGFVERVLASQYPSLAKSMEPKVNDMLIAQLQTFRTGYGTLNQGSQISYSTELARFAYMFGYTPVRANAVYDALRQTPELQELFDQPQLRVACVGGGPGSDLLGLAKYLARREKDTKKIPPAISATVCDRIGEWKEWWVLLEENLRNGPSSVNIQAQYLPHDILDPATWSGIDGLAECHLYTISYCMGEFRTRQTEADPYFHQVVASASTGSWFVFIDNNHSKDYGWFDRICTKHGLLVANRSSAESPFKLEHAERDEAMTRYKNSFGGAYPNVKLDRSMRVCRKK